MIPTFFERVHSREGITAEGYNALCAAVERLCLLDASPPILLDDTGAGPFLSLADISLTLDWSDTSDGSGSILDGRHDQYTCPCSRMPRRL